MPDETTEPSFDERFCRLVDRQAAIRSDIGDSIRFGISVEKHSDIGVIKESQLSEENIDWLAAWLAGTGFIRENKNYG